MKKIVLSTASALLAFATSAHAADLDRELGLIVSGVVDQWAGVQIIDGPAIDTGMQQNGPEFGSDTDALFASGGEGLLSLPLGENISIQNDFKYEFNSTATGEDTNVIGMRGFYQGAAHLSWRNPASGLFGVFGGLGTASLAGFDTNAHFVGGEAQFYMGDVTFYAQGGYVNFSSEELSVDEEFEFAGLEDGLFARGVVRWFPTSDSRLQFEGTYLNADFGGTGFGGMDAFSVKARYDFMLNDLPVIGNLPVFIAYRGTFRDDCFKLSGVFDDDPVDESLGIDDHTIMVGTSYSFSGDRLAIDRQGATLDTPDFNYSCAAQRFDLRDVED